MSSVVLTSVYDLVFLERYYFSSLTVTGINKAQYSLGISWIIIQVNSMDSIKGPSIITIYLNNVTCLIINN